MPSRMRRLRSTIGMMLLTLGLGIPLVWGVTLLRGQEHHPVLVDGDIGQMERPADPTLTRTGQDTPDVVHAAWIAALETTDRDQALDLTVPGDTQAIFVDESLRDAQERVSGGWAWRDGAFVTVDILPVTTDARGVTGISVWRFTEKNLCYRTTLTATEVGWRVSQWGQTECRTLPGSS